MSDGANLGTAKGAITLDISGLTAALAAATGQLQRFQQSTSAFAASTAKMTSGIAAGTKDLQGFQGAANNITDSLNQVATTAGVMGGGLALALGSAAKSFASFEQQINQAGVVSGATAEELNQLSDLALQIGQDTAFGATEAARALTELAKAGVPLEAIFAGAGRAAADLAAATGTDLTFAANSLATTMALFSDTGLTAAQSADILTAAANASVGDVNTLTAGLRSLGPVVATFGGNLQDAAAAIAYFSNFGLKAADVGVSLTAALNRASAPTEDAAKAMRKYGIVVFDTMGKFIGFPRLLDNLRSSLGDLTDEQRTAALTTIFGAEAQDVLNIAINQGSDGYVKLRETIEPAGQAAESANARMKGLAGSVEQMKGSLETAAIIAGGALAPSLEKVAGVVESLADAFSALPAPVQQAAVGFAAVSSGLLLMTAAAAKTISFAFTAAESFRKLNTVIQNSQRATALLTAATSPAGLAAIGLAVGIGILIKRHQDAKREAAEHAAAVRALEAAFTDFAKVVDNLRLRGLDEDADAVEHLRQGMQAYVDVLNKAAEASKRGETQGENGENFFDIITDFEGSTVDIEEAAAAMAASIGKVMEALQTPGVDIPKLSAEFASLNNALFQGQISPAEYAERITHVTTNLNDFKIATDDSTDALAAQKTAMEEAEERAAKLAEEYEKFINQVDETSAASLNAIKGIEDIADSIDGLQEGFGTAGDTIEDILLLMDRDARLNLDFSDAEKDALKLSNALKRVDDKLADVRAEIANNSEDMSMWSENISLVDDTIGTLEDGYAALNQMVADGALEEAEANEIKEAGIWLRERSVGGLEDERVEQARQIPILRKYVEEHDNADRSVKNLTDAQRGFIAAMESSQGQTALQTLQTLAYLAAIGAIPASKVTDFIVNASEADATVGALFDDLGLLDEAGDFTVNADTDDATAAINDVEEGLTNIPGVKEIVVTTTVEGSGVHGDGTGVGMDFGVIPIEAEVAPPDTSAIDDYVPDPVEIPAVFETPDDAAIVAYKPATVDIPTKLGAPDETAITGLKPAILTIPSIIGTPDATLLALVKPNTVTIPTELSSPVVADMLMPEIPAVQIPVTLADPTAAIDIDTTNADTAIQGINDDLDVLEGTLASPAVDIAHADFDLAYTDITADLDTLETSLSSPDVTIDASGFNSAYASITRALNNLAASTYTVSVSANIGPALAALNELGKNLPSSPAEKGPLSRTPSFDYVVESFVASMEKMDRVAQSSLARVGENFDDVNRMRDAAYGAGFFANDIASLQSSLGRLSVMPTQSGQTVVQQISAPTYAALQSEQLIDLISKAESGDRQATEARNWIKQYTEGAG